jgi:hypothetical protein
MNRLLVALSLVCVSACGPTVPPCTRTTCLGCCDATGVCRSGGEPSACGSSGAACAVCGAGASCSFGTCGTPGGATGGGASGGGAGGSGGGSTGTITDWASFCREVTAAVTAYFLRCGEYTAQGAAEYERATVASCLAEPPAGFADGRARFDAAAAQRCLPEFQRATCATGIPSGCDGVVVGLVPLNGSCFQSRDYCTQGAWCDASTTCPGRCVPRVAIGQPATPQTVCVEGAYPYGGVCTALVPMGQSCAPTGGSTQPRFCLNGLCTNGVCGPRPPDLAEGQACQPNTGPECSRGLQCANGTCVPLVDVNGACDTVRRCKADLSCGVANACVRPGVAGMACGDTQRCASGHYCERPAGSPNGTCRVFRQMGAACSSIVECDSATMYCTVESGPPAGTCQLKGGVGAPCTNATGFFACREGLYCTATSTSPSGVCANKKSTGAMCTRSDECQNAPCTMGRCGRPNFCQDPLP